MAHCHELLHARAHLILDAGVSRPILPVHNESTFYIITLFVTRKVYISSWLASSLFSSHCTKKEKKYFNDTQALTTENEISGAACTPTFTACLLLLIN